jgi:hypothetical protein
VIIRGKSHIPKEARNAVRRLLHFQNPANFPIGPRGLKLDDLFMGVTARRSYGDAVTCCEACGYRVRGVTDTFSQYINVWNANVLRQRYPQGPTLSQWFQYLFDHQAGQCSQCRLNGIQTKMRMLTTIHEVPSLIILSLQLFAVQQARTVFSSFLGIL